MSEKISMFSDQGRKENQPHILLPEELKQLIKPKEESKEERKTASAQFYEKELSAKRNLLDRMKKKDLSTGGLEAEIEKLERLKQESEKGAGHA